MKRNLILICMSILCVLIVSADDAEILIGMGDKEYIPYFRDEVSDLCFVYANPEKNALRFVEPLYHSGLNFDSFTLYNQSDFDIPEYVDIHGSRLPVVAIESQALANAAVRNIKLPSTIEIIEPNSIQYCSSNSIELNDGLKLVMKGSFFSLDNLAEIQLPNSLYQIQDDCFVNTALREISFNEGLSFIGENCFKSNSRLEEVILSSTLRSLGNGSFSNCENLKVVSVPAFITDFSGCFNDCPNIELLKFNTIMPYAMPGEDCFNKLNSAKCKVIVPDGCKNNYLHGGWSDFTVLEFSEASVLENIDSDPSPLLYYNLSGIKSQNNLEPGIYIQKSSNKSIKIFKR